MKKYLLYATFAIAGIVVISGCGKQATSISDNVQQDMRAVVEKKVSDTKGVFRGSIAGLLAMGKAQKCEWNDDGGSGTFYTDGKRIRSDAVSNYDGERFEVSMINDGEWMYTWNSMQNKGQKFKLSDMEKMQEQFENAGMMADEEDGNQKVDNNLVDMDKEFSLSCEKWHVDTKKFEPPANVVFEDMSAALKQMQEAMPRIQENMQEQCNRLPAQYRSECLKSMQQ